MRKINFKKLKRENNKSRHVIKNRKVKTPKERKIKKSKSKNRKILNFFLILLTLFAIAAILGVIGFGYYIVKSAPEFNPELLYEKEATLVYDSEENLIATLGAEKREKVTYDELPEILVDAIIATEDSRFFQHNGFDLPRFFKAALGQVIGKSGAGGGSTLTMQISKNAFTSVERNGIEGIIRKFTDIYMSIFKIEKKYTKEEIIEFYVNTPYLGSESYGVEQASQTYFGKSVSDLSLPETALIAGLFQAPGSYDPYSNPEDAQTRKNTVLNLMVRHGYITKEQSEIAKKITAEELLQKNNTFKVNKYQGFIETVVREITLETKNNPYDVPMIIYTTMVASKQDVINNFYNEKLGYKFKDDAVQVGIALVNNETGALMAVGAGRNKSDNKKMQWNYAVQTKTHPGSTAKPIFDYGPGIEYLKWSTYTPFFDEPTKYGSGKTLSNWDNKHNGMMSLRDCLADSRNTCALQAFRQVDNKKIYNFATSLGIYPESEDEYINEAHSVGAFTGVSPVQMAGAYAAFGSGGYYTKPYSYTKIVYRDNDMVYESDVKRNRVMSAQTAYLIADILLDVTPNSAKVSGSQVATKTGTSSYDSSISEKYKLSSLIRDSWVASFTKDYTMVFWYGYDKITQEYVDKKYYNTFNAASTQRKLIMTSLVPRLMEKNSKFKRPSGIVNSKVEFGTIPAQLPSNYTPKDLIQSHLFISGTEPTEVSTRFSKLSDPINVTLEEENKIAYLSWDSPGIPTAVDTSYLTDYFNNNYGSFADKYYKKRLSYNKSNIGDFGFDIYLVKGTSTKHIGWTTSNSYTINLSNYDTTYDSVIVKSAYSKFKSNASTGVTKNLSTYSVISISISMSPLSLATDASWNGSNSDFITGIKLNGVDTSGYEIIKIDATSATNTKTNQSVSVSNVTKEAGSYEVKYSVTFVLAGTQYTKPATQTVTVTNQ